MTVEFAKDRKFVKNPGTCVDDWVSGCHFCLVPVFFRITLSRSGGCSPIDGWMPLHDAVEVNCKNGAYTDTQT